MNSRERVLAVLSRETPDRVPVDIWLVPELVGKFKQKLGVDDELEIYRRLGVDKIAWLGVPYRGVMFKDPNEHGRTDHWGVGYQTIGANSNTRYGEACFHPLLEMENPAALADYPWPDPDAYDYETAAADARRLSAEFVTLGPWISIFEVYCKMRTLEQALMDTVMHPEFLDAALERIFRVQGEMLKRFLRAAKGAVDMVFISDDMGTQNSLLMSPAAFSEFILPRLRDWCTLVHSFGAKVFFHTDGAAGPLIPALVEAGIDVLNPIQHVCPGMARRELKAKFGDRLIFHGGVENQRILPFGTAAEVTAETRECLEELGPAGYIPCSCHFAQADTPLENVLALVETVQQYKLK